MKITSFQKLALAVGTALLFLLPNSALAARTDSLWDYPLGGNYYKTNGSPSGVDILIYGSNHYLNWGSLSGSTGYGLRDNAGTIEFKNQGGAWAGIGSGGGGGSAYPFTPLTNYATTMSATTSPLWAQAGIYASSTTAFPTLAIQQSGAGPAATFMGGAVGIGTASPTNTLEIGGGGSFPAAIVRLNDSNDAQQLIFANGSTNRFRIRQNGAGLKFESLSSSLGRFFNFTGGTLVNGDNGNNSLLSVGGTFNDVSNKYNGLIVDVTNTASAVNSAIADFRVGGLSKLFVDVSGNVGVGTTTPQGRLTVHGGQLTIPMGLVGAPGFAFNDDLSTGIYSTATGKISIGTAGANRITIDNNGLFVNGNAAFGGTAIVASTILQIASNLQDPSVSSYGANISRTLVITADNSQPVTGGNFNVSTSNNSFNLTGVIAGGGFTVQNSLNNTASDVRGGNFLVYNTGTGLVTNGYGSYSSIQNLTGAGRITNAYAYYAGTGFNNSTISNWYGLYVNTPPAASTTYAVYTNGATQSYFGGNVGLGTTTPGTILSIQGVENVTTATTTRYSTGGINLTGGGCFAISNVCVGGGAAGVTGVSNSDGTLTISPTTGAVVASIALGHANSWTGLANFLNASSTLSSAGQLWVGTTATTTITNTGKIGIGTTTPGTSLSIGNTGANTINISETATSTFGSGINIGTGCFAIGGTCLSTGGGALATTTKIGDLPAWQIGKQQLIITATGTTTITIPSGITKLFVELQAGAASGAGNGTGAVRTGGGGAGAYCFKVVDVTGQSTVDVGVGTGGASVFGAANSGLPTLFGTAAQSFYFYAQGGTGPGANQSGGGVGGGCINADGGQPGGHGRNAITTLTSGDGGDSHFGAGGVGSNGSFGDTGATGFGSGGQGCNTGSGGCAGRAGQPGEAIIRW